MDKISTVAQMAATIFAQGEAHKPTFDAEEMYERVAAQAWALFDAVEKAAAQRHSRR